MLERWPLIVADFRREYPHDDLRTMSTPMFLWLLQGLSEHSVFLHAWRNQPKVLHPDDRRALFKAAAR